VAGRAQADSSNAAKTGNRVIDQILSNLDPSIAAP